MVRIILYSTTKTFPSDNAISFFPDHQAVTGEKESVPDKAKLVFAENYPRLQKIKKQYDPNSIFDKWFPITPA